MSRADRPGIMPADADRNRMRVAARIALLVLAALLVNVILGLHRWLPGTRWILVVAPTAETAVILTALLAATRLSRRRSAGVHWPLAGLAAVLVLFGIGEAFYQTIFRKGFVPWTDLGFLPALLNMVLHTEAFSSTVLVVLPLFVLAAVVATVMFLLIRWIDSLLRSLPLPAAGATAALLTLLAVPVLAAGFRTPLTARAAAQLRPPQQQPQAAPRVTYAEPAASATSYAFPGLRDHDIHLFIVESYGHTLFSNPAHRELIRPAYDELEDLLQEQGYHTYSAFMKSPAFGGRSWLADATLLTGTFIDSQYAYDRMLGSDGTNLTHILGEAGYHRVLAAPGTYEAEQTWKRFYAFDDYLFRYDFGYQGPFISFGAMPDQYLMYRTHEAVTGIDSPLFVNYVLVSSHVPFDRVPPYLDDWKELGDGSIFNEIPLRLFNNNWLSGGEYPEGYVASIEYTLTSAVTYITDVVADGSLFIIVGDHQPRIPISEQTATFSVPIHVISRDADLVREFGRYGFSPGIVPSQPLPHPGTDTFLPILLDVASGRSTAHGVIVP